MSSEILSFKLKSEVVFNAAKNAAEYYELLASLHVEKQIKDKMKTPFFMNDRTYEQASLCVIVKNLTFTKKRIANSFRTYVFAQEILKLLSLHQDEFLFLSKDDTLMINKMLSLDISTCKII